MEAAELAANIITYNAAISACEKCNLAGWIGLSLGHPKLVQNSLFSRIFCQCRHLGKRWLTALNIFEKLRDLRLEATVVTYAACISACEKGGQWTRALHFLAELVSWP